MQFQVDCYHMKRQMHYIQKQVQIQRLIQCIEEQQTQLMDVCIIGLGLRSTLAACGLWAAASAPGLSGFGDGDFAGVRPVITVLKSKIS